MAPFVFAGRRWVAPADLGRSQYGGPGSEFDPPPGVSYAATYWIAPGHLNDYFAWSAARDPSWLRKAATSPTADLVFVSFADRIGTVYRDESVPADVFELVDPPGGMVVQLIDVPDTSDRDAAAAWLIGELLPQRLAAEGASAHSVLVFRGAADTSAMRPALQDLQRQADNGGRRLLLLWFLDRDPREEWESEIAPLPDLISQSSRSGASSGRPRMCRYIWGQTTASTTSSRLGVDVRMIISIDSLTRRD